GKTLLNLVDDILDLSKLEAKQLTLTPTSVDLYELIDTTLSDLRSLADGKGLTLKHDLDLSNPTVINDEHRLRQVLMNLVSNAIKFTDLGYVRVGLTDHGPDHITLTVEDTGIGIAQNQLPHIFEAFRQVDQTIRRERPGTGLGLAIVHSLVTVMGGTTAVSSTLGQGSLFTVTLPRQIAALPSADAFGIKGR
ncbi:MAG: HAMP domain-containing sensor histidine kinase, partial [Nodosilinea sp.]